MSANPYGYDKMSSTDLRKVIADLTKSNLEVLAEKKEYLEGVKDVVKELNTKIKSAVEALRESEANDKNSSHETNVKNFLSSVGTK